MQRLLAATVFLNLGFYLVTPDVKASSYTISITDERIVPNVIAVSANEKAHFTIHNYGKKTHNFVLPAFYIFTPNLSPQEGTTVEFVPEKKGMFSFYSDTGGKPEPGLSGTMQVK